MTLAGQAPAGQGAEIASRVLASNFGNFDAAQRELSRLAVTNPHLYRLYAPAAPALEAMKRAQLADCLSRATGSQP